MSPTWRCVNEQQHQQQHYVDQGYAVRPPTSFNSPITQLYNEDINDLLAPENSKLQVHESREGYPFVAGLREDIVTGAEQVLALLDAGEQHRHIGETRMNKNSSRSHTIFRMVRKEWVGT